MTEHNTQANLISVIVPCYNQAEYLGEALDSVLKQCYQNWECIIVNDGSADNTASIAEAYKERDSRFKYIYQDNAGLSAARNAGVKACKGEYILPLDADDKIGPDYTKSAIEVFSSNNEITLVYSQAELFGAESGAWYLRPYTYKEILKSNMIFCSAVFKRADFEAVGGYDEDLKIGYEDWDLYLRLLTPQSVVVQLNAVHFFYRIKKQSMLTAIDEAKQQKLNWFIYNKHRDKYMTYFESPVNMLRKIDMYEQMYKNSADYKLGNKVVGPVRKWVSLVKSVFK